MILKIVNEIETLISEDRNGNHFIEDLKRNFPDEFEKIALKKLYI